MSNSLESRIRARIAALTQQIAEVEMHFHFEIAARRKTIEELEALLKEDADGLDIPAHLDE